MKILALETSAKAVSCAVWQDGMPLACSWQSTGLTHSRTLMPMVEAMLHNSVLTLAGIDGIAVAAGPGSFTGLRIGIAAAKGLAWAAEKPCIPVSTLLAMAMPLSHWEGARIVCAMDARRQQIYNAIFTVEEGSLIRRAEDRAIALSSVAAELKETDRRPTLIVGDGAVLCRDFLEGEGIRCSLAPPHLLMQSASGVAMAALEPLLTGRTVTAQDLSPVYLRLSQAERERLARQQAQI